MKQKSLQYLKAGFIGAAGYRAAHTAGKIAALAVSVVREMAVSLWGWDKTVCVIWAWAMARFVAFVFGSKVDSRI